MSNEIQKAAEELSNAICGSMEAHLVESIVSLFNQGILVHYIREPRTVVDPDNFKLTVEAASGVKFEGREKIIDLQSRLDIAVEALETLKARWDRVGAEKTVSYTIVYEALKRIKSKIDREPRT